MEDPCLPLNQMCFSEASFSIFNWSKCQTTLLRKKDKTEEFTDEM